MSLRQRAVAGLERSRSRRPSRRRPPPRRRRTGPRRRPPASTRWSLRRPPARSSGPDPLRPAPAARAKAPATLVRRARRPRSNCGDVLRVRSEPRARASAAARDLGGEQNRLIVATPPGSLGVDRYRHQQLPADARRSPASRHGRRQWARQPPLARVLELVQRRPHRAGERRAPLQLSEWHRHRRRQPDRDARRQREPDVQGLTAGRAQRALGRATCAGCRQRDVEQGRCRPAEAPAPRRRSGSSSLRCHIGS